MRVQPSQSVRGSGRAPWIALQAFVIRAAPLSHRSNIAVAMTATDLKRLCGGAFRGSTFRLRRGRANTADAPSKSSPGLYPETLSIRYRYRSDGSIAVATPKGPRYFDDLTDFWSAHHRAPSFAASPSNAVGLLLPTSERRLRALVIMLSVLVLVLFVHEIARDFSAGAIPEPAAAKSDTESGAEIEIEITGALAEPRKDSEPSPAETNSPPKPDKPEQAVETAERADARVDVVPLRLASEQGDAEAQFLMGRMYEEGKGVPSDFVEAMKWYRLAAEQGHVTAQYKLGLMYGQGRGMPRDLVEAHRWMTLAASRPPVSDTEPQAGLTPAQLVEANRLARRWEQQAVGR